MGKSAVAANIIVILSLVGKVVSLLDLDIYNCDLLRLLSFTDVQLYLEFGHIKPIFLSCIPQLGHVLKAYDHQGWARSLIGICRPRSGLSLSFLRGHVEAQLILHGDRFSDAMGVPTCRALQTFGLSLHGHR
ncbi:hypothetical protein DSUL_80039 [Desulfovibrionales bacterium]